MNKVTKEQDTVKGAFSDCALSTSYDQRLARFVLRNLSDASNKCEELMEKSVKALVQALVAVVKFIKMRLKL